MRSFLTARKLREFDREKLSPFVSAKCRMPVNMKCPYCGFGQDRVVDSRESKEADSIRQRRECERCNRRFTTYERIDEIPYMVVKKDGRRERFDRQKVLSGLLRACEKRPVPSKQPGGDRRYRRELSAGCARARTHDAARLAK